VPDATVLEMVRERKVCLHCRGGFILDGFPRTVGQAESLRKLMQDEGLSLNAVINYDLPAHEIVQRLGGRRTCSQCKAVYNVSERPPKVADRCDVCHGSLFQREAGHGELAEDHRDDQDGRREHRGAQVRQQDAPQGDEQSAAEGA